MAVKSHLAHYSKRVALLSLVATSVPAFSTDQLPHPECGAIEDTDYPSPNVRVASHSDFAKAHFVERIAQFLKEPLTCAELVLLGDSLTEQHNWSQDIKSDWPIRNRGIAGDTSDGVLLRLDEIIRAKPKILLFLIGTNDLWSSNSPHEISRNIALATSNIHSHSPNTKIFVQTVFPIRSEPLLNSKVLKINRFLREQSDIRPYEVVDTYALMADSKGLLRSEFTSDGVHLNVAGYAAWAGLINSTIEKGR